jgi:molecular chaperone GrpE
MTDNKEELFDTPEASADAIDARASEDFTAGTDQTEVDFLQKENSAIGSQDDEDEEPDWAEQIKAQQDKYLRLMAEFDNYKRRSLREFDQIREQANEKLMVDFIEVRETFLRALDSPNSQQDPAKFLEGMKLLFAKLDEILKKHGLEVFTEVGETFDPLIHDAMLQMPHPAHAANSIVQIFEKGYKLKSKVIRHAKVIVSSGAPAPAPEGTEPPPTVTE